MTRDNDGDMPASGQVSRRWLLRNTVNVTAAFVAVGAVSVDGAETTPTATPVAPDHDAVTGEIFDRAKHHHWDTV